MRVMAKNIDGYGRYGYKTGRLSAAKMLALITTQHTMNLIDLLIFFPVSYEANVSVVLQLGVGGMTR